MAPWSKLHSETTIQAQTRQTERKGIEISPLGDENEIPLALAIAGANVHDMVWVTETLDTIIAFRPLYTAIFIGVIITY